MPIRTVDIAERRARLALRHGFAPGDRPVSTSDSAATVESMTDDLVVLHASDPATVFLSLCARLPDVTVGDVEAALYDRRSMLRTLAMRRTLFVVTTNTAPIVEASSSADVAAVERRRLEQFLAESGIADPAAWLAGVASEVMEALADAGPDGLQARELTKRAPRLGTRIVMAAGTKHSVTAGATSRVLGLMAVEGMLVRGRPSGDWTGRQHHWHRRDEWFSKSPTSELTEADASSRLLGRWLERFGPGTVADMKWWTGWTMTKTRTALATLHTVEVALGEPDGPVGYLLAGDAEPLGDAADGLEPWAALLPSLDPTPMGWKEREWYLGNHKGELFDRNGNVGPTIWVDGRIVGGWSQTKDGAVVTELLESVGSEYRRLIDAEVERTETFLGETVVRPSFPTPLQKRLSA